MKTKYLFILTALAATVALASCSKELNPGKVDIGQPDGTLRTITVSFGTSTKSSIGDYSDGGYPVYFSAGDSIMVSNGDACEKCVVFPKDKMVLLHPQMAIETSLEGPLTAVYPASSAILDGNAISPDVRVPSEQSGSFADANICMANQENILKSEDVLEFTTKVTIFRFYTKDIGVDTIRIKTSDIYIATESTEITVAPKVDTTPAVAVAVEVEPSRYWYAAIARVKELSIGDLTIESVTSTQDTVVSKSLTGTGGLDGNKMYNVFIPYYIKVNVGTETEPEIQKWAYCNIGAFEPEESGDYFMWGEIKGHKLPPAGTVSQYGLFYSDFINFDFNDTNRYINATPNYGFDIVNAPYFDVDTPNKYTGTDSKTTLDPTDDAATDNWGEGWRMPTKEEFEKLMAMDYVTDGSGWMQFGDYLYFPATGSGNGLDLFDSPTTHYWSSTLGDQDGKAWTLYTGKTSVEIDGRSLGYPIRPIYDPAPENQSLTMTITPYTSGGTL